MGNQSVAYFISSTIQAESAKRIHDIQSGRGSRPGGFFAIIKGGNNGEAVIKATDLEEASEHYAQTDTSDGKKLTGYSVTVISKCA